MYNELGIIRKALFCNVLYESARTVNMSKMALNSFCDETLNFLNNVNIEEFKLMGKKENAYNFYYWIIAYLFFFQKKIKLMVHVH